MQFGGWVGEGEEVGIPLLMVEGDQAIGEDESGIRGRGPVRSHPPGLRLQLVPEVADEAAIEVERQPRHGRSGPWKRAGEEIEDRFAAHLAPSPVLDPQQPRHHLSGADVRHAYLGDHVQKIRIALDLKRFCLVNGRQFVNDKARF